MTLRQLFAQGRQEMVHAERVDHPHVDVRGAAPVQPEKLVGVVERQKHDVAVVVVLVETEDERDGELARQIVFGFVGDLVFPGGRVAFDQLGQA